ncbi:MAG: WecB/TagA/CpsF family glycosyltransferase [Ktedonobacterales bacterium]
MESALAWMTERIERARTDGDGQTAQIVTLNAEIALAARHNMSLRRAIAGAALVVPDGAGVVWAGGLRARVTGVDLLEAFAGVAAAHGYRLYLLGGAPGVAEVAAARLVARHRGLVVASSARGTPDIAERATQAARIRDARADVVFVAFGSPAQELWIADARGALGAAVAIGAGGALDFVAGRVPRAPVWLRRHGLEWLYRLARQPWRWRRMLALPRFVVAVWAERLGQRRADEARE